MTSSSRILVEPTGIGERLQRFIDSRGGAYLVWGVAGIGVLLRLLNLTSKPFWFDEAYVYWVSVGSWGDMLFRHQTYHIDPPFVGVILNVIERLGIPPLGMRVLPFVFGAGSVLLFTRFALKALPRFAALFATVIISFSYNGIAYSQEITEYPVGLFLTLVLLLSVPWPGQKAAAGSWIVTGTVWVLSPWMFYGMAFVLAAFSIVWIARWSFDTERNWQALAIFCGINAVTAISAILVYWFFLRFQIGDAEKPYLDAFYADLGSIQGFVSHLFRGAQSMSDFTFGGKWVLTAVFVFGLLLLTVRRPQAEWFAVFLVILLLLYVASAFRFYPFYGGRQTMFVLPFVAMLIALAVEWALGRVSVRFFSIGGCLAAVVLTLYGLKLSYSYHRFEGNENILPSISLIQEHGRDGDGIYVHPKAGPAFFLHDAELVLPRYRPMPNPMDYLFKPSQDHSAEFRAFVDEFPRVWIVLAHYNDEIVKPLMEDLPKGYTARRVRKDLGAELWFAEREADGG